MMDPLEALSVALANHGHSVSSSTLRAALAHAGLRISDTGAAAANAHLAEHARLGAIPASVAVDMQAGAHLTDHRIRL